MVNHTGAGGLQSFKVNEKTKFTYRVIECILNKRPERPYPALHYSEKGHQVSEGEQPSASDLQKF